MQLIEELQTEHLLIERVVGSLRTFVDRRLRGEAPPTDAERFLRFFRRYSGGYHHAREEDVLFPALSARAELPRERGPIAALLHDHHDMAGTLEAMAPLLGGALETQGERETLRTLAIRYSRALWAHIDAENSVLFPESEERLRRVGVHELENRPMTPGEAESRADGQLLVQVYPPSDDPEILRGEGCTVCPAHGVRCDGVEREWWSELEWEDFFERVG